MDADGKGLPHLAGAVGQGSPSSLFLSQSLLFGEQIMPQVPKVSQIVLHFNEVEIGVLVREGCRLGVEPIAGERVNATSIYCAQVLDRLLKEVRDFHSSLSANKRRYLSRAAHDVVSGEAVSRRVGA